jgi:hypothetical protein
VLTSFKCERQKPSLPSPAQRTLPPEWTLEQRQLRAAVRPHHRSPVNLRAHSLVVALGARWPWASAMSLPGALRVLALTGSSGRRALMMTQFLVINMFPLIVLIIIPLFVTDARAGPAGHASWRMILGAFDVRDPLRGLDADQLLRTPSRREPGRGRAAWTAASRMRGDGPRGAAGGAARRRSPRAIYIFVTSWNEYLFAIDAGRPGRAHGDGGGADPSSASSRDRNGAC